MYPHHLAVVRYPENIFKMLTQKFNGADDSKSVLLLDTFLVNGSFKDGAQLFPDKMFDLDGKNLRMSTLTYVPYTITKSVVRYYRANN